MTACRSIRRCLGVALMLAASLWLASARADAQSAEVRIVGYAFVPAELTVKVGTAVKWTNGEKRTSHSILFTGPGGFESERLFPDESWERRFEQPGRYPYTCGPHPEMKGLIIVAP